MTSSNSSLLNPQKAQYAGFSLTPIIATFLTTFSRWIQGASSTDGSSSFLACIVPGVALAIANILLVPLILLYMPARDPCAMPQTTTSEKAKQPLLSSPSKHHLDRKPSTQQLQDPSQLSSPTRSNSQPPPDTQDPTLKYGFILFLFLNFVLRGIIGVSETTAPNTYAHILSQTPPPTTLPNPDPFFFYLGLTGLLTFLLINPLQTHLLSPTNLLTTGTLLIATGTLLTLDPYPPINPSTFPTFLTGMLLIWSIGSPICQTLTLSAFSKMLGRRPQGGMVAWLGTAASLGRIVFPALVGLGPKVVNVVDVALCGVCCCGVVGYTWYVRRVGERERTAETVGLVDGPAGRV